MRSHNRIHKLVAGMVVVAAAGAGVFASAPAAIAATPAVTANSSEYLPYASLDIASDEPPTLRNVRVGDTIVFTFRIRNAGNQIFSALEYALTGSTSQTGWDDWPLYLGETRELKASYSVTEADIARGYALCDLLVYGHGFRGDDGVPFRAESWHRAGVLIANDSGR